MCNKNILIIEDDIEISTMLKNHLRIEGFIVDTSFDGEEALKKLSHNTYHLILLDLMIPKINGMAVLKKLRLISKVSVIIISAKNNEIDKTLGLEFGADDYISKPFSLIELTARIKANIRRVTKYAEEDEQVHILGNIHIDFNNYSVRKSNKEIYLTAKEYKILRLFVKNPKRVYTKQQIYNQVWNEEYYGDENVINVHIRRLREKLEDNPSNPKYIITVWGIGYKLGEVL